jgi:hypothetical protein
MAGRTIESEIDEILAEARRRAAGFPSAAEGKTGLQERLNGIEEAIRALARVMHNAFAESDRPDRER